MPQFSGQWGIPTEFGGAQPGAGGWWGNDANAYGTRPTVPDPTQTAQAAISGNIANLGNIYGLGAGLNRFQAQQAASQIAQNLPGYQDMIAKSSGNIQQMLSGQLPSDVVSGIYQQAGERGLTPMGAQTNLAALKLLGGNTLQMEQAGDQMVTGAIQRTPTGGLFQPSSMLVTPEQQQAATAAGQLYAAGPDPSTAAQASLRNAMAGLAAGRGIGGGGGVMSGIPSASYGLPGGQGFGPIGATSTPTQEPSQSNWYSSIGYNPNQPQASPTAGWGGWQGGKMYPDSWTGGGTPNSFGYGVGGSWSQPDTSPGMAAPFTLGPTGPQNNPDYAVQQQNNQNWFSNLWNSGTNAVPASPSTNAPVGTAPWNTPQSWQQPDTSWQTPSTITNQSWQTPSAVTNDSGFLFSVGTGQPGTPPLVPSSMYNLPLPTGGATNYGTMTEEELPDWW